MNFWQEGRRPWFWARRTPERPRWLKQISVIATSACRLVRVAPLGFVLGMLCVATACGQARQHAAFRLNPRANPERRPSLYEENPLQSMSIRVEHWRQIERYVTRLEISRTNGTSLRPKIATGPAHDPEGHRLHRLLVERLGYPPPGFTSPQPPRLTTIGRDSLATYYRCFIRVTPELDAYGLYVVPHRTRSPAPLVIAQHGGGGFPELALFNGGANYHDLIRGALRQGWLVYAPLLVFYPYRDRDVGTPIPPDVRARLDKRLRVLGSSLGAVEIAQIQRALDVLLVRPEVDAQRVAMVGLSYGGFYTLFTAALDPRIRIVVTSCAFVDRTGDHWDETGPAGWDDGGALTELPPAELCQLICPRPLQVQAGRSDSIFDVNKVRAEVRRAARVYARREAADAFDYVEFEGGHEFRGEFAWPFLRRHFARSAESSVQP